MRGEFLPTRELLVTNLRLSVGVLLDCGATMREIGLLYEAATVTEILERTRGNQLAASRTLDIHRNTLARIAKRTHIRVPSLRGTRRSQNTMNSVHRELTKERFGL